MTNNEVSAKGVLALIELDLEAIDSGDHLMFLFFHEETGPLVPLNWLKRLGHPEWIHDWERFMKGQSYLEHGFFIRDVRRFLTTRLKK